MATVELYAAGGISMLAMEGPPSPIKRLRAHFARMNAYAKKHTPGQGCLLANFSAELSEDSGELRQALNKAMNNWYKAVAIVIRQAQDAGEIAKHHKADVLARCLVNAWEGTSLRVRATRSFAPVDEFFKITFEALLK